MSSWVRIGDRVKTKAEMDTRAQRAARKKTLKNR